MKSFRIFLLTTFGLCALSGCTSGELATSLFKEQYKPQYKVGNPYVVDGKLYYPTEVANYVEEGQASWYGPGFHGRMTANGEQFDTGDMTAAHRTLPLPSVVRVTNLDNGKTVFVRVNDRGPFKRNRIIDVSKSAAKALDFHGAGTTRVRVEFMPNESHIVAEAAKQGAVIPLADVLARTGGDRAVAAANVTPPIVDASDNSASYQNASYQVPGTGDNPPAVISADAVNARANVLHEPVSYNAVSKTSFVPAAAHSKVQHAVYIQIGAYADRQHAVAVQKKLAKIGAAQIDTINRGGAKLYRVRMAAADHASAEKILKSMDKLGLNGAKVIKE